MAVSKVENYEGTADTFTFPYNPKSVDATTNSNHQITSINFQNRHILISGGGFSAGTKIFNGHFSGNSRWDNYRELGKHFGQTKQLKKLYFEDDKFWLGIGGQLKRTHTSERTLFIDYVFSFQVIIEMLFGDTEKTSGTNDGNADTYITEITGDYDGAGDVILSDNQGNELTVPASAFSASGDSFTYKLVQMVNSGSNIFVSEYAYVEINSVQTKQTQTTDGFGVLQLGKDEDVSVIGTTNLSNVTIKFRDGWYT